MKRFGLYIIILLGSLLTVGCCKDDDELPPPEPTIQPRAEMERTVIVYMAGDNSLGDASSYNAIPKDTAEMVLGKAMIPEDVNFIIFVDDRQHKPAIYELSQKGGMQLWKQYKEELCTSDSQTMLNVLREIEQYFPARHYGITFWSHASGWAPTRMSTRLKTFGQDLDRGTTDGPLEMEIPVLRSVLAQLPKFDYIFFDACFMQCVEVAYQLRHVTDYVIGSPAELPGDGAAYLNLLQPMCQIPTNVDRLLEYYVDYYLNGRGRVPYTGAEISAIRTDKVEALASASAPYLQRIFSGRRSPECGNVQKYYVGPSQNHYTEFYDFKNLMYHHLSAEEYAEWCEAYDAAVPFAPLTPTWYSAFSPADNHICKIADLEHTGGVSLFVPSEEYARKGWVDKYHGYDWYHATGMENTGW